MHATAVSVHHPSAHLGDEPDGEGMALLLDLMADEPIAAPRPAGPPSPPWTTRVLELSRWASSWGAGPQGAWRAW